MPNQIDGQLFTLTKLNQCLGGLAFLHLTLVGLPSQINTNMLVGCAGVLTSLRACPPFSCVCGVCVVLRCLLSGVFVFMCGYLRYFVWCVCVAA